MAETEREFARVTTVKGVRDAFLEFFAPDSLAFTPGATSARDRLLKQEATPFSVDELLWEPRLGDVSASGDLGWLTGPSTYVDHCVTPATPHYGNYLSVWRQSGRRPMAGLHRCGYAAAVGSGVRARVHAHADGVTLYRQRGRTRGRSVAAGGRPRPECGGGRRWRRACLRRRLDPVDAAAPAGHACAVAGTEAVAAWLEANAAGMSATSTSAEAASSGDFGYSYGRYEQAEGRRRSLHPPVEPRQLRPLAARRRCHPESFAAFGLTLADGSWGSWGSRFIGSGSERFKVRFKVSVHGSSVRFRSPRRTPEWAEPNVAREPVNHTCRSGDRLPRRGCDLPATC